MSITVKETELPGVLIFEPRVFADSRGYFLELWNEASYEEGGASSRFVQDNISFSRRGVLRGLHYQHPCAQGKLVSVLQGEVFDVAVDIRIGSATFGKWTGVVLSAENHRQLYVPEGFAHGFQVTSDTALFSYKCTNPYQPAFEGVIRWDDPDIRIPWPEASPILNARDGSALYLSELAADRLPKFV